MARDDNSRSRDEDSSTHITDPTMHPGWKPPESADGSGADAQPATRKSGMDGAAVSNEADRAATSALTGVGLLMEAVACWGVVAVKACPSDRSCVTAAPFTNSE